MSYYDKFGDFGEKTAAIDARGEQVSYAELAAFAKEVGKRVPARSLVFSFCRNEIGSMAGYLAFLNNRIVPLMLDAKINEVLLTNLMDIYQPQYVWMPEDMAADYASMEKVYEAYGYQLLRTGFATVYPLNDELALLLTTSGSTGSPKLVRQSYTNIESNAEAIAKYLEITEEERPVSTLPMNYTYGLSIVNSHVLKGATILLTEHPIVSKAFWDFMKQEKATSFGGVPYTYEMLKRVKFFKMDLPDLKTFTQAGGKLSPELHKEFAEYAMEHGKYFVVMYGQTEATARMAYLPYEMALKKYGSMGVAIPGGKFSLIDVDGNAIEEPEVVGELVYEGDNVTLGYAECGQDLIKGDERQGRLETGDMAKRDADGYYFIVGRKKRFLKLFGNRINLDEIDRMVKSAFENVDCASTGTDEMMNVYITDAAYVTQVEELIAERTHINNRAFTVKVIDQIPRNEAGKTLYKDLPQ